jgi:DNA-binding CsgD family transcriptional regulator
MAEDLIDRIYECALVPELWPDVLDELSRIAEARGGLVFSARKGVCWTASGRVADLFNEYFRDGWFDRCSRRVCSMAAGKQSFFVEHDFWTDDQLADDPMYKELFRPHGCGWSSWTGLRMPTGDEIVVSIERPFTRGPMEREVVERLNTVRPHLVRSALVSGRMGLQRAQGAAEALMRLGMPALLIDGGGRMVEGNAMLGELANIMRLGSGDRVLLSDPKAQDALNAALAANAAPDTASRTVPLRDREGSPTALMHIMPIRRSAHDILGESYALLIVAPVAGGRTAPADVLCSLFGLTASEARVARGLARGDAPEQIARDGGVAITTVRSQIRKVLEKTGCTRQAEVAALLAPLSLAPS